MSEPNEPPQEDLIPRFRFSEKKVDSSWKDEVLKEKELLKEKEDAPKSKPSKVTPISEGKTTERAETDETSKDNTHKVNKIFLSFIAQMVQQTLMQLGKIEHPMTGQPEVDLEGARYTLELLAALEEKTRGNLAEQEKRGLTEALRELKMHYIETVNALKQQMQAQMNKQPPGRGR